MNWFKKSSPVHHANPRSNQERHKRVKKTQTTTTKTTSSSTTLTSSLKSTLSLSKSKSKSSLSSSTTAPPAAEHLADMSKSLCSLDTQNIELLDPEEFFHDPEHVRHYKEEAVFLRIMSEWEFVERPSHLSDNYFSADFEDELLQRCTQQNSLESVAADSSTEPPQQVVAQMTTTLRAGCKRKLLELLFVDEIQTGIAVPTQHANVAVSQREREYEREVATTSAYLRQKKMKYTTNKKTSEMNVAEREAESALTMAVTNFNDDGNVVGSAICRNKVRKDCAINREQLKTEALAGSIMGAIGQCPGKDSAQNELVLNINLDTASETKAETVQKTTTQQQPDACHPSNLRNACDHYDIKQFFRLDDNGNILLNMSHIVEFQGYGYAIAQNSRLFRRYRRGCACAHEQDCRERGCCTILRRILLRLWIMLVGHPRNKINVYSSGPGDSLRSYTLQLAQDQKSTFARNIENFISCTKESREAAPQVVMRNMRQFMNGMKNYLVKHGEGKFHQEVELARSRLKSDEFLNLDAILETVMHQLVVLPLREHLYGMFVDYYTRSEAIQVLAQNVKYACGRSAIDFGIRASVSPPTSTSLNIISNLLLRLQEAELPLDKLDLFLCVISTIYDATCPRGQQLSADDLLPVLVYVVAKCGFVGAEIEAEFMWGLLQQTLLNGEPGYYLTALCSAVHVLKSFKSNENESGTGSLDWRSSQCIPACSSVLRVIIPDECNGSLQTRTLPVRPHTTTRDVCRIIAHKARITNPQDYALFKLVDGEETLLTDAECPQDVRLAAKGKHCMLAYKRIDAKIAWPTTTTSTTLTSTSSSAAAAAASATQQSLNGTSGN